MGCCKWLNPVYWFTRRQTVEEETCSGPTEQDLEYLRSRGLQYHTASSYERTLQRLRDAENRSGPTEQDLEYLRSRGLHFHTVSSYERTLSRLQSPYGGQSARQSLSGAAVSTGRGAQKSRAGSPANVPVKHGRKTLKHVFSDHSGG